MRELLALPARRWRAASALAGFVVLAVAVSPPMDSQADTSLTAHMVQHVLLLAVAGPLFGIAARRTQSGPSWGRWLATTALLQAVVMWVWHAPVLFDTAVRVEPLHMLEHVSFLVTSAMFWSTIAASGPSRYGVGVLAVFGSAMAGTGLGAAMLLAPHPWYPIYARAAGAGALADQQLAGVVMWSFMGLVDVIAAVVLFARWLAVGEGPLPSFAGASR